MTDVSAGEAEAKGGEVAEQAVRHERIVPTWQLIHPIFGGGLSWTARGD